MTMPSIRFIEGEPPPAKSGGGGQVVSPFIVGQLCSRPGVWAEVDTGSRLPINVANQLREAGKRLGVIVEATARGHTVYARVVADE